MILNFEEIKDKYKLNIRGVIHIGAHYGEEHSIYLKNNIKDIVYFEPLSSNFKILESNVGNEAILYNFALGSKEQEVEMFVESANNGQSSSILEPKLHITQYPYITFDKKELVKVKCLDDVIEDYSKYNFINIDVQGYELEVFKGSMKILNNIDYIISEINRDEVYNNCTKVEELKLFLSDYGFILVEEDWMGGTWGDGFFIKKNKIKL